MKLRVNFLNTPLQRKIKSTIDILQRTTAKPLKKGLMESSSKLAIHSVEDADRASHALEEINTAVALISDMATQIATAAEEQNARDGWNYPKHYDH